MVSSAALTDQVRKALKTPLNKTVYVKADARADFQSVAKVVDAVRDAGVSRLGLETQKLTPMAM